MAIAIPDSLPPAHLQIRALPALIERLDITQPDLSLLKTVFALSARSHFRHHAITDIRPLQALQKTLDNGESISVEIIIDAIVSYPSHLNIISTIIDSAIRSDPNLVETIRTLIIPHIVTRLRLSDNTTDLSIACSIILGILRSHEELLGLVLSEADYVLPALKDAYAKLASDKQSLKAKNDILCICHSLISVMGNHGTGGREALKRLMSDSAGSSKRVLVDGSLKSDYEAVYERKSGIENEEIVILRQLQEDEAKKDPRVQSLQNLFPDIPAVALLRALTHSEYVPRKSGTIEEAAAPLLDAIVSGGQSLPDDLDDLKRAIKNNLPESETPSVMTKTGKVNRSNIWNEEALDVSRLRIKDDDDVPMPQMGNSIPDHLRASIMRLVQSQEEEEEEEARALREAHGEPIEEGEDDTRGIKVAEGEESENEEGDKVVTRKTNDGVYNVDQQSKLELAYLSNPKIFDRDSITRRSEARRKLKELTKMDDAQLEGWRIMLDRNPHKEAILSRHTFAPKNNYLDPGAGSGSNSRGNNHHTHSNPSGENSRGGRGGRGGGGSSGGGSRGRGSKGSRGHSNAARTRGHDKKMSRMGAGV